MGEGKRGSGKKWIFEPTVDRVPHQSKDDSSSWPCRSSNSMALAICVDGGGQTRERQRSAQTGHS